MPRLAYGPFLCLALLSCSETTTPGAKESEELNQAENLLDDAPPNCPTSTRLDLRIRKAIRPPRPRPPPTSGSARSAPAGPASSWDRPGTGNYCRRRSASADRATSRNSCANPAGCHCSQAAIVAERDSLAEAEHLLRLTRRDAGGRLLGEARGTAAGAIALGLALMAHVLWRWPCFCLP